MVHRRGAEDAEGGVLNKKLCVLCASAVESCFSFSVAALPH